MDPAVLSVIAEAVQTFPVQMLALLVGVVVLARVSEGIARRITWLRKTRYRGKAVCTGKVRRFLDGTVLYRGNMRGDTRAQAQKCAEPDLLELQLDNGARSIVPVSPLVYERARLGEAVPRRLASRAVRYSVGMAV